MSKKPENPSAFPVAASEAREPTGEGKIKVYLRPAQAGMTLLDYFAGYAMLGLFMAYGPTKNPSELAEIVYNEAEAMLAEREKRSCAGSSPSSD